MAKRKNKGAAKNLTPNRVVKILNQTYTDKELQDFRKSKWVTYKGSVEGWCLSALALDILKVMPPNKKMYDTAIERCHLDARQRAAIVIFGQKQWNQIYKLRERRSRRNPPPKPHKNSMERLRDHRESYLATWFGFPGRLIVLHDQKKASVEIDYDLIPRGYSASCPWDKREYTTTIRLPKGMHTPGLSHCDGILNLALMKRKEIDGITLEKMWVAIKGRGHSYSTKVQWIASCTRTDESNGYVSYYYYHADTVADAMRGLQRKLVLAAKRREPTLLMDDVVTRQVFRKITGACKPGIQGFCERNGLEDVEEMKVRDLLPLLKGAWGEREFRAAIIDLDEGSGLVA